MTDEGLQGLKCSLKVNAIVILGFHVMSYIYVGVNFKQRHGHWSVELTDNVYCMCMVAQYEEF